jgi:hypothetical protein
MSNSRFGSMGSSAATSSHFYSPPPPESPVKSAPQGESYLVELQGAGGSAMKPASYAPANGYKKLQGNVLGNSYFSSIGTGATSSSPSYPPPPPACPVDSAPQGGSYLEAVPGASGPTTLLPMHTPTPAMSWGTRTLASLVLIPQGGSYVEALPSWGTRALAPYR